MYREMGSDSPVRHIRQFDRCCGSPQLRTNRAWLRHVRRDLCGLAGNLAGEEGFEPTTYGFGDRHSNQLSYSPTPPLPISASPKLQEQRGGRSTSFGRRTRTAHRTDRPLLNGSERQAAVGQDLLSLSVGIMIGLGIAAPVGPISILCIERTLRYGFPAGLATGAGASATHLLLAGLLVFGVGRSMLPNLDERWATTIGSGMLLLFAARLWQRAPVTSMEIAPPVNLAQAFGSAVATNLVNPMTMLFYMAAMPMLSRHDLVGHCVVIGIFAGSLAWWIALCGGLSFVRGRLDLRAACWTSRASALMIAAMAIISLATIR